MTYDLQEESRQGGRPVELYRFNRDYQAWRYTSADRAITIDSQIYQPRAIRRSAIEESSEMRKSNLKIVAPRDLEVADLYRISPPTLPVTFTLSQYHDSDALAEVITVWTGRVLNVEWQGAEAHFTLEPIYTALRRVGLRRMYQRQCPHVLYGTACGLNREAFRVDGTADGISGVTLTVSAAAAKADGFFAGGFIEYEVALGIFERRFITAHTGSTLTVTSLPQGLEAGAAVKLYPGCDHTLTTCDTKFNNVPNYGGMPYFPLKNPFAGDPVY